MDREFPSIGSRVFVRHGSFKGFEGILEHIDHPTKIGTIRMKIFGRDASVCVSMRSLMDAERHRVAISRLHDRRYHAWASNKLASLNDADYSIRRLDNVAGSYSQPSPLASGLLLTLSNNGQLVLQHWLDLGGVWSPLFDGFYLVHNGVIHSNMTHVDFYDGSFTQDGKLHLREIASKRILVPQESIAEVDRLLRHSNDVQFDLEESGLALKLFFSE